jgi:hypothetical protein
MLASGLGCWETRYAGTEKSAGRTRAPLHGGGLHPPDSLPLLLNAIRRLHLMDDTFHLRAESIDQSNGMVSRTFSCDGTH